MEAGRALQAIYFADPMCSWCWGFVPTIDLIREQFGEDLPIRLVMGGLRPGTDEPMTNSAKADVKSHWEHVHEASGQPFDFSFFDRRSFVYDTDPAARAVVAVRREDASLEYPFFKGVQKAFYADNRDVTDPAVLAEIAAGIGIDESKFVACFGSTAVREETFRDYATSQRSGIRGFPTLFIGPNSQGAFSLVTHGYRGPSELMPLVRELLTAIR